MEARFYTSMIATALCEAGRFVLFGIQLRPLCLLHTVQLDALENPLWNGGDFDESDLWIAAQICASDNPVLFDTPPEPLAHDFADAIRVWREYLRACAAAPEVKSNIGNAQGNRLKAPRELLVATYLVRMLNITLSEAWRMPVGLAYWYLESAREQEEGDSWILTEDESKHLDYLNSPEGKAAMAKQQAQAVAVHSFFEGKLRDATPENRPKVEAEMMKLLTKAGTLPDDWEATWQM